MHKGNDKYSSHKPKLWVYNYDFEFEIAGLKPDTFSRQQCFPWYFLNRSSLLFLPLSKINDSILIYDQPDTLLLDSLGQKLSYLPQFTPIKPKQETNSIFSDLIISPLMFNDLKRYRLQPWGWSQKAIQYSSQFCRPPISPINIDDVITLNSKQTSNHLREAYLPDKMKIPSRSIHPNKISLAELATIVKQFQKEHPCFFIKHYFGTAGRLTNYSDTADFSNRKLKRWKAWINKHKGILLEKKLDIRDEWSIQVEVTPEKEVIPLTITKLYSGRDGAYWGNLLGVKAEKLEKDLNRALEPVFEKIRQTEYQGPIGFDFIETTEHQFKLLEINTRFTMGRIAFEWHKKINTFSYGLFFNLFFPYSPHQNVKQILDSFSKLEKNSPCQVNLINLVPGQSSGITLISGIVGAESQELIWKIHQNINQIMKIPPQLSRK